MRVSEVISSLQRRGVILKVMSGSLKIGGVDRLTDREKVTLRAHKDAILWALERPPTPTSGQPLPAPLRDSTAATAVSIANRQAMPQVAAAVDQLREVFGPIQVVFASEGGKELGREPPPGVKPMITGAGAPKRTIRKGLRV